MARKEIKYWCPHNCGHNEQEDFTECPRCGEKC